MRLNFMDIFFLALCHVSIIPKMQMNFVLFFSLLVNILYILVRVRVRVDSTVNIFVA